MEALRAALAAGQPNAVDSNGTHSYPCWRAGFGDAFAGLLAGTAR